MSEDTDKEDIPTAFVIDKESFCGVDDKKKSKLDINQQTLRTLIVEGLRKTTRDPHRWNRCFSALQFILSHIDFSEEYRAIMTLEDTKEWFIGYKESVKAYQKGLMERIYNGDRQTLVNGMVIDVNFFKHDLGDCIEEIDDIAISLSKKFRMVVNENQAQITDAIGGEDLGVILGVKDVAENVDE